MRHYLGSFSIEVEGAPVIEKDEGATVYAWPMSSDCCDCRVLITVQEAFATLGESVDMFKMAMRCVGDKLLSEEECSVGNVPAAKVVGNHNGKVVYTLLLDYGGSSYAISENGGVGALDSFRLETN